MLKRISVAARLGSVQNGPKIIDQGVKKRMNQLFDQIASGKFPRQLAQMTPEQVRELDRSLHTLSDKRLERAVKKFR
jgi:ketol-acid reductoisomerase